MRKAFIFLAVAVFLASFCFSAQGEQTAENAAEDEIKRMFYQYVTYECEGDVEKASELIDWENYDVEPGGIFQKIYKMSVTDEMKAITKRNWLSGKFSAIKQAYDKLGHNQIKENYMILDIILNDALDDATIIYTHKIGKETIKVHKKNEQWLLYREIGN